MEEGHIGSALQLNVLGYGQQNKSLNDPKAQVSFDRMMQNMDTVPFVPDNAQNVEYVHVTPIEKLEASLARFAARTGVYPDTKEEIEAMKKFNVIPSVPDMPWQTVPSSPSHSTDSNGVLTNGDCLFHSIWLALWCLDRTDEITHQQMRELAVGFLTHEPQRQELGITHEYLRAMLRPGTWGGALEAMALAYVFGVQINLRGPDYIVEFNTPGPNQQPRDAIDIYYNGVDHYSIGPMASSSSNSTRKADDTSTREAG